VRGFAACLALLVSAGACAQERVPVIGLPCDGCEAVFEGIPAEIPSRVRIGAADEPGNAMVVEGRVYDAQGEVAPGIVVYAHQTDKDGIYPEVPGVRDRAARRHGRLRGWVKTDAEGTYAFDTIRPGSYPGQDVPQHIHLMVLEPGCFTYYIGDIMFRDDPKLTAEQLRRADLGRAGSGIVTPQRKDGTWRVTRDIHLGRNIPGYSECKP